MNVFTATIAGALLSLPIVLGIKKCKKIDACRCSTDEGEINLWSLADDTPGHPRFSFAEANVTVVSKQTEDSYQWNPCIPWTARRLPNETAENKCKDVAVCLTRKTTGFGTLRRNIGEQNLSDCIIDQDPGRCVLRYNVASDRHVKTLITLVCNETEIGRMDPMKRFPNTFYTSLRSECACPGRCKGTPPNTRPSTGGLSAGAVAGIVVGSVAALLLLSFAVFICCLRQRLSDEAPKPSMCTTIEVGCGVVTNKWCKCCRRYQYSSIPGN